MTKKMHILTGFLPSYFLLVAFAEKVSNMGGFYNKIADEWTNPAGIAFFTILIGLTIPDLDIYFPPIFIGAKGIKGMIRHRGITHHLIIPIALMAIGYIFRKSNPYMSLFYFALGIGWMMHIIQDMFSVTGVPNPFHFDYDKRWKIPVYKTGSLSELLGGVVYLLVTGIVIALLLPVL